MIALLIVPNKRSTHSLWQEFRETLMSGKEPKESFNKMKTKEQKN